MESKQPTETQIQEFWEWCRVRPIARDYSVSGGYTNMPKPIYPDIDLNSLFQYAVLKLRIDYGEEKTLRILTDWVQEVILHYDTAREHEAEMLQEAIWEVTHGN